MFLKLSTLSNTTTGIKEKKMNEREKNENEAIFLTGKIILIGPKFIRTDDGKKIISFK